MKNHRLIPILIGGIVLTASAGATIVPFTEDFNADSADWFGPMAFFPLDWFDSGGPDGGAYASGVFNFRSAAVDDTPAILRAQDELGSSGGAFVGDWIADGVNDFSFEFRHDAPGPVTVFARFAGPAGFPGAVGVEFVPVLPGQWTQIDFSIAPDSPALVTFEGTSFEEVFSSIGDIQIGVFVDDTLAGLDQDVRFDIDKVTIVPAPGAIAWLAPLAGVGLRRRRRGR